MIGWSANRREGKMQLSGGSDSGEKRLISMFRSTGAETDQHK